MSDVNESPKKIVIDITEESFARPMKQDEFIRGEEAKRLGEMVLKAVQNGRDSEQKRWNVFFVNGTRGAGKSTFLRTVVESLCKSEENKVVDLAFIDPTKIDTGEHILLSLLATLDSKLNLFFNCSRDWDEKNGIQYEEWRKNLKDIAGGLNLLSSPDGSRKSMDDGYLDRLISLNNKIDNAKDGLDLRGGIGKIFSSAREILGVDAFIVSFDDVDTNFKKGWDVLESIRRYGDIPGLIFVVTGDLQLYTHLVRDNQFRNFSDSLAKNDSARSEERVKLVDHLEQQYLLKIFPLGQRVHLASLNDLLPRRKEDKSVFFVKFKGVGVDRNKFSDDLHSSEMPFKLAVEKMLQEGLSLAGQSRLSQLKSYVDEFLKMSVRTILQVLVGYNNSPQLSKPKALTESLRGALLGNLYKQGVDAEALSRGSFAKLVEAVFDTTLDGGDNDTGFYLRPQAEGEALRACAFVLAAEVAAMCEDSPGLTLKYILQGPGSVSLFTVADGLKNEPKDRKLFKEYMGLGRDETSRHWAIRSPGVFSGKALTSSGSNKINVGCGYIRLNSRTPHGMGGGNTIPISRYLNQKGRGAERLFADVVALSLCTVQAKVPALFFSIFSLLGTIESLLLLLDDFRDFLRNNPSSTELGDKLKKEINSILKKAKSGTSVTAAPWITGDIDDNEGDDNEGDDDEDDSSLESASSEERYLVECVAEWLESIAEIDLVPSALFMGKIWSRLFFGLSNIASSNESILGIDGAKGRTFWDFVFLNVCCILNAILLEEYGYSADLNDCKEDSGQAEKERINFTMENPSKSPKVYIDNVLKLSEFIYFKHGNDIDFREKVRESFPLFYILSTCPLMAVFEWGMYTTSKSSVDLFAGSADVADHAVAAGKSVFDSIEIISSKTNLNIKDSDEKKKVIDDAKLTIDILKKIMASIQKAAVNAKKAAASQEIVSALREVVVSLQEILSIASRFETTLQSIDFNSLIKNELDVLREGVVVIEKTVRRVEGVANNLSSSHKGSDLTLLSGSKHTDYFNFIKRICSYMDFMEIDPEIINIDKIAALGRLRPIWIAGVGKKKKTQDAF